MLFLTHCAFLISAQHTGYDLPRFHGLFYPDWLYSHFIQLLHPLSLGTAFLASLTFDLRSELAINSGLGTVDTPSSVLPLKGEEERHRSRAS